MSELNLLGLHLVKQVSEVFGMHIGFLKDACDPIILFQCEPRSLEPSLLRQLSKGTNVLGQTTSLS